MLLTSTGYSLKFIQADPVNDSSDHLKSYIFKFFSEKNKLHYVVRAEYHKHDFFAVKFYAKKDRKSDRKYNIVTNKGDVANILITCAKSIPYLLQLFPGASFGFIGSRTVDFSSEKVEGFVNNQRFRLYNYHLPQLIGNETFFHVSFRTASSYALINKTNKDMEKYKEFVKQMVIDTYDEILEIS